jgi:hypothetical protein
MCFRDGLGDRPGDGFAIEGDDIALGCGLLPGRIGFVVGVLESRIHPSRRFFDFAQLPRLGRNGIEVLLMSRHFPVHLVAQVILVRDLKLGLSGWEKVAVLDEGEVNSPLHVLLPAVQVTRQTSGQRHDDSFEVLFGNSRVVSSSDHIFQGVRVKSLVHVVGATVLGLLFGNPNTPRFGGFECEIEETEFLV